MRRMGLVICRGGGDLATGITYRLTRAGFRVLILETGKPAAIRRQVSFCEAVYDGRAVVEGLTAVRLKTGTDGLPDREEIEQTFVRGMIPLIVDPGGRSIEALKPDVVVDAIIAKRNLGTRIDMAPLVIGVGPGFTAGEDVHLVVETMRGHNLGRIYTEGSALPNTGIPGLIAGVGADRVIHAQGEGHIRNICHIGDSVEAGQEIARIYPQEPAREDYLSVRTQISGILRGLIRDGYRVNRGFKIADVDPRPGEYRNCFTISDKSRSIGGSVLEAVCAYYNQL